MIFNRFVSFLLVKNEFSDYIRSQIGDSKVKIIVVCSGNIIRSPFVELVLKTQLSKNQKVIFESGACFYQNSSILDFTVHWLRKVGVNEHLITEFTPRYLLSNDSHFNFSNSDIFIAMTSEHLKFLNKNFSSSKSYLIKEIVLNRAEDVLDPYFNNELATQIMKELYELSVKLSHIIKKSLIT